MLQTGCGNHAYRLRRNCRNVAERLHKKLQRGCRKLAKRLRRGCKDVAERLQKGYRKVTEGLQVAERLQEGCRMVALQKVPSNVFSILQIFLINVFSDPTPARARCKDDVSITRKVSQIIMHIWVGPDINTT